MRTSLGYFLALSLGWAGQPALAVPEPAPLQLAQFQTDEQINIRVYQQASPAVVTIQAGNGAGSGSLISPEGLVLTNQHVVGAAGRVRVATADGRQYTGRVIGVDRRNDLALVRLENTAGERFPVIPLANASGIQVGQRVFAIGSPFGLRGTLTTGILSRITPEGDLQTDAAINPGNSGGPLLNSRGELIGVNKAILSVNGQGNIGIGFATSAPTARTFIAQNQDNTELAKREANPPRLGVVVDARTLTIRNVESRSLAAQVGLRSGDRLVGLNGRPLRRLQDLLTYLDTYPQRAVLTVVRGRSVADVLVRF
ncbi:MAG: trypsin-like peptidase domain-containing protein [Gloeomargaritaceae cyanobacterium C42_A2020_066]|nr:trypsin-like peptidase domain-containing protein [Gloeomargaritaceae cyanobacterium C42_A2020_066]